MMENNETKNVEEQQAAASENVENNTQPEVEAQPEAVQTPEERIAELEALLAAQRDTYLRTMAEFDNYRKRTLTEKQDLLKYGAQDALKALLPVIDDFERAIAHMQKAEDINALREGIELIYQKFQKYLEQQQMTVIPAAQGDAFDDSIHEAVAMFPAPDPSLVHKVVDCVTKGYKLNDKVVRYAKVVVGQ